VSGDRELQFFMARVADQAERYTDVLTYIEAVIVVLRGTGRAAQELTIRSSSSFRVKIVSDSAAQSRMLSYQSAQTHRCGLTVATGRCHFAQKTRSSIKIISCRTGKDRCGSKGVVQKWLFHRQLFRRLDSKWVM
jgi:uncharacterized protein with PIN domain